MKLIGQGRTADVFEYDEHKIVKLYKRDFPEAAIQEEFRVSNLAFSLGIHTPKPFELTYLDSRHGIVFQRIAGVTLLKKLTMKPWEIHILSRTYFMKVIVNIIRQRLKKEYIKEYLKITGSSYSDIDKWILPVAAARLVEWVPKDEKDNIVRLIRDRLKELS